MLYQLPNGRVIEISTEQYIDMTDEELEYLIAYNYGDTQENPWFGSVLMKQAKEEPDMLPDLTDVPEDEKLMDPDLDMDSAEE
jgi:hypothetical protein